MERMMRTILVTAALWLPASSSAQVVISEFRLRGPAGGNDEFVEIYNAGTGEVDVGGWKLMGSNSSGTTSVRATIPAGTSMPPRTFLLFTNTAASSGYSGSVPGDVTYTTGIADNGGLALVDAAGTPVDQVGLATGSAYKEGTTLLPFSSTNKNQSYERKSASCGPDQDTGDNAADFDYHDGISYPQNSRSCRLACAGDPCIAPPAPACMDPTVLLTPGAGTCGADGFCSYEVVPQTCEFGCQAEPAPAHCQADPCQGVVCETPPNDQCYRTPGACSGGLCAYEMQPPGTSCDDGNLCSDQDACTDQGDCRGVLRTCEVPGPECQENDTVSRLYLEASCQPTTGLCEFTWQDTTCTFGCDPATGLCQNDPCAGVVCNTPPNAQCYAATGSCVDGTCVYAPLGTDTVCDDGNPCTDLDHCDGTGNCSGTARVCDTPPNAQCYPALGSCVDGACTYRPLDAGTPCNDGDLCTDADACGADAGCSGTPRTCPVPAPFCLDAATARVGLTAACNPADGACAVTSRDIACGQAGCQEATGLCAPHPVISLFRTRGPGGGNDEFIEIYNPSGEVVDVGSWKIQASNKSGLTGVRFTLPVGTLMGPGTFLLLANPSSNGYSEATPPDFTYSTGITDDGGLALARPDGQVVDAVGMDLGSAFREGTPLAPTTVNQRQAYQRGTLRCGPDRDLDDNATDFQWVTGDDVHPRNSRSCRLECSGPPCVSRPADRCADPAIRVFYGDGTCLDGFCDYPEHQETCPFGCQDGLCLPDPCAGVVCDSPPNFFCYMSPGTCSGGTCTYVPLAAGQQCDDGSLCTTGDQCDGAGTCAGAPVECPPRSPECLSPTTSRTYAAGECSPSTGECVHPYVDTVCSFGCNEATGLCLGDPCNGVVCNEPPSVCHQAQGVCSQGACTYALRSPGALCDDGDPCTLGDSCDAEGACLGTPMTCHTPQGPCQQEEGTCVEGQCRYDGKPASSPCDDGDPCTTGDQCTEEGACLGTPVPGCGEDLGGGDLGGPDAGGDTDATQPPDPGSSEEAGPGEDSASRPDVPGDQATPPDFGSDVPAVQDVPEDGTLLLDVHGSGDVSSSKKGGGCSAGASGSGLGWLLAVLGATWLATSRRRSRRPC